MRQPCTRPSMLAAILFLIAVAARAQTAPHDAPAALRFVENRGQIVDVDKHRRPDILFTLRDRSVAAYLRTTGMSYVFRRIEGAPSLRSLAVQRTEPALPDTSMKITTWRMDVELLGANTSARVGGEDPAPDRENYYLPQCPQGITDVRRYSRVVYHDIYPHIDLVYHVNGSGMKYDFVLHPGGRVSDIRMRYVGAEGMELGDDGTLRARTPLGEIQDGRPSAYAESGSGHRTAVSAAYRKSGDTITFAVAGVDRRSTLVIDPQILWSTFLGGTGEDEVGYLPFNGGVVAGCSSNHDTLTSLAGATASLDFPTTAGVFSPAKNGGSGDYDLVVARFTYRGARVWATYYGGSAHDQIGGMYTDATGRTYVTGITMSTNVTITPGAFNPTHTPVMSYTGLAVVFDRNGQLVWSTYINGMYSWAITSDLRGNVYVGGAGFWFMPTTPGAFRTAPPAVNWATGGLIKFTANGTMVWQTFYGGSANVGPAPYLDRVSCLATDSLGNLAACGASSTTNFPLVNSRLGGYGGDMSDGWVALLDSNGTPKWSTYVGGSGVDGCSALRFDSHRNLALVSSTASPNFPLGGHIDQPTIAGGPNDFDIAVTQFDTAGVILWSTYLGGGSLETGLSVDVDPNDNIWMGGLTRSPAFPTTADGYQRTLRGAIDGALAKYDPTGHRLWSTFLGGSGSDMVNGIASTSAGLTVFGMTDSSDFPIAGTPFQPNYRGVSDFFLTFFCDIHASISTQGRPTRFCNGDSVVLTATPGFTSYHWNTGATTRGITVKTGGTYWATVDFDICSASTDTITVTIFPTPERRLQPGGTLLICAGDTGIIQLDRPAAAYLWSTGDTTAKIAVTKAGRYSAVFTDAYGCTNHTDTMTVIVSPRPSATITALGPLSFCEGGSVDLEVNPAAAGYRWSTGETTQRITVTKPGTYMVQAVNADGCKGPASLPVTVKVFPNPKVSIRNVLPTKFCEGDSTILVASPATFASYLWSTGATTSMITVRKEGTYTLTATDSNGCTATAQMNVSVTPAPHPKLTTSGPTRFCQGDSVILSVNGALQAQWSNGSTSQSIVVKSPGKYFVTVTNDGGCLGVSDTATVEVLALPSVAVSGPVQVCPNTLATYSVPGSSRARYAWDVPGNGAITGSSSTNVVAVQWGAIGSGSLHVRVTNDSTGCSADTTIAVTISTSLKPAVTANRSLKLCTGDSVTLDAGAYATYQWSTGATTRTITTSVPGAYTVTVADAKGCGGTSDPVVVTVNAPPAPAIAVPNGGVFCVGDSIVLDAGAGYANYLWSNGFTSRRIVLRASGRAAVTVTDTNGCTGTSPEVTVTASPATPPVVTGPIQVCRNSTVTYATPLTAGSSYQWSVTGGAVQSGQGTASVRVAWGAGAAGHVGLIETTSLGCMGASPGLDVTIGDHLVPTVTPSGSIALCPGSTAHLDAGAGYASYQWSTGEKTQSIDVTNAGSYTVTVADSSGCSGTSDPVGVFTKAAPVPAISGGPLEFCEGGSVTLTADAGYTSYLWSTGATTSAVTVSTAGAYTVTVTDIDGCTGTSKPVSVIVDPLPPKPVITLVGDQFTSTPALMYQWQLDGVSIPGALLQTLKAGANGMYRVIVGNQFGCSAISDPLPYRTSASPRLVMLDTISARVGERRYLTMRVLPALTAADAVHAYHAELRYDPRALFIHDVVSPDRATTGDPAMHLTDVTGLLTVDRPATSPVLIGDELFRVELEGLVTGRPLDVMTIERIAMPEVSSVSVVGSGLVILSGCEIGTAFAKVVRIDAIRPNPARDEMIVRYRLPAGKVGELRLSDAAGREVARTTTPVGTGSFEELRVDLAHVASGVYMIELRDGAERSAVPVVIAK